MIVLLDWLVEAMLPAPSYIESTSGTTVIISLPSGVPVKGRTKVYTLPEMDILDGVDCDKVACPPEMERTKSDTSKSPVPPFVL